MSASSSWIVAFVLLAAVTFSYSNHFHNAFQFDDHHSIPNNASLRSLANVPRFFTDPTTSSANRSHYSWRPMVTTSLAVDYWLGKGYNTFFFHLSNFLWFVATLLCLPRLFQVVLDRADPNPRNFWIAWFATAWYGLHPATAETVNYIIQRADIMSTFGIVAGLLVYARSPSLRRFGVYLIPVAFGLLSKPPALIFPAILAAYLFLIEEQSRPGSWGKVLRQCVPALALSVVFLVLQSALTPKTFDPGAASASRYLLTQPYVWFRCFVSFFLPLHLSADTDLTALSSVFSLEAIGGFVFVAFLLFAMYVAAKHVAGRPIAFGLAWFVLALIPTSAFPLAEVENDHRMFLPFCGLTLAVTWAAAIMLTRQILSRESRIAVGAAAACVLLLSAAGTRRRNEVWRTEESLWRDVTLKSPRNGRGLMNYGLARMSEGDLQGALILFERALAYTPNYPSLAVNLGVCYGALGRGVDAERQFLRAIQLAPGEADSHFFYGRWLRDQGRLDQAAGQLRQTLGINVSHLDARDLLLGIYADQGAQALLQPLAQETLRVAPDDLIARRYAADTPPSVAAAVPVHTSPEALLNLSMDAYQKKDYEACIRFAQLALKQRPNYAEAYNNLMAAFNSLGRWDAAIQAGHEALRIKPDYELARNNLLWAESQKKQLSNGSR